ncbi:rCG33427 [Rattus norvegicus]|uniref:RCG33427 n=1 Tax=Rattus norvegicus TaxID=10116 RepID=A6HEP9_RAT|nr:rCG33427 [Rattus norvegicus]
MVHAFNPALRKQREVDLCEFLANQGTLWMSDPCEDMRGCSQKVLTKWTSSHGLGS